MTLRACSSSSAKISVWSRFSSHPAFSRTTCSWAVRVKLTWRCFNASGAHARSCPHPQAGRPSRLGRSLSGPDARRHDLRRRASLRDREAGARFLFLRVGRWAHRRSVAPLHSCLQRHSDHSSTARHQQQAAAASIVDAVPMVSFIVGEGRLFTRPDPYPIATPVARTSESFGNRWCSPRFGTVGSVVRIHSPRPLSHGLFRHIGNRSFRR